MEASEAYSRASLSRNRRLPARCRSGEVWGNEDDDEGEGEGEEEEEGIDEEEEGIDEEEE